LAPFDVSSRPANPRHDPPGHIIASGPCVDQPRLADTPTPPGWSASFNSRRSAREEGLSIAVGKLVNVACWHRAAPGSTHWGQDAIGIPIGRPTGTKASTSITGATLPNRLIGNRIPAHQASQ